jgi:hypothetical protein
MPTLLYVLLAVLLPIGWGLFSAWAFEAWRRRRGIKTLNIHRSGQDIKPQEPGAGVTSESPRSELPRTGPHRHEPHRKEQGSA